MHNNQSKEEEDKSVVLDEAKEKYASMYNETIKHIGMLHVHKEEAVRNLKNVDVLMKSLSNKPIEFDRIMALANTRRKTLEREFATLGIKSMNAYNFGGNITETGFIIAKTRIISISFGPAFATTFGMDSTGTSVEILRKAAIDLARDYFLGDSIMLGQSIPLHLFGFGRNKTKKQADEPNKGVIREIEKKIDELRRIDAKIVSEIEDVSHLNFEIENKFSDLLQLSNKEYQQLSDSENCMLMQLVNSSEALSKRIGVKIS